MLGWPFKHRSPTMTPTRFTALAAACAAAALLAGCATSVDGQAARSSAPQSVPTASKPQATTTAPTTTIEATPIDHDDERSIITCAADGSGQAVYSDGTIEPSSICGTWEVSAPSTWEPREYEELPPWTWEPEPWPEDDEPWTPAPDAGGGPVWQEPEPEPKVRDPRLPPAPQHGVEASAGGGCIKGSTGRDVSTGRSLYCITGPVIDGPGIWAYSDGSTSSFPG